MEEAEKKKRKERKKKRRWLKKWKVDCLFVCLFLCSIAWSLGIRPPPSPIPFRRSETCFKNSRRDRFDGEEVDGWSFFLGFRQ